MQTEITNTSIKQPNSNRDKSRKKWLIGALSVTVALIVLLFINLNWVVVGYEYVFKFDHFSEGQKIYLPKRNPFNHNRPIQTVVLMKLIKPLNEREIDTMLISDRQKTILKAKIDPSAKPYLINAGDVVRCFDKSSLVGTYAGHDVERVMSNVNTLVFVNTYIIKPDTKALEVQNYHDLPEGYTWANNNYYIAPVLVSNEDQSNLK